MTIAQFKTISDMKRAVKDSGSHFFDEFYVNMLHTKIEGPLLSGSYFITSEYMEDPTERKYTARYFTEPKAEGQRYEDETIGEFRAYDSLAEARAAVYGFLVEQRGKHEVKSTLDAGGVEFGTDANGHTVLRAEGKELRASLTFNDNQATGGVRIGDEVITVREFASPRGFANYVKSWILEKGN